MAKIRQRSEIKIIGRTNEIGGGDPHGHGLTIEDTDTLPPYFALADIMKK